MGEKLKISELFSFEKGPLQSSKNEPGDYDFITASSEWKTHSSYSHDCEALLVAVAASGSLGRTHYVSGKFIGSDLCFILTPKNQDKYPLNLKLYYHIFNAVKEDLVYRTATGSAKKAINKTNFGNYKIPYFDIETQNKYAKLFDEFVILKSSLEHEIQFQEEYLAKIRQSILQEAVKGKLTEEWRVQNPKVEPAHELIKKIIAEKEQLIKEKKIKREKPLPKITREEIPFEIPKSWEWSKINDVTIIGTGATPLKSNPSYYGGDIPWYTSSATNKLFTEKSDVFITQKALKETNCRVYPKGTLIVAMYGQGKTRGQVSEIVIPGATNQAISALVFMDSSKSSKDFVKYYFQKIYLEIRKLAEGGAQPNLSVGKIKNTIVPFPPLEEQKTIVKKVNDLFTKCDVLDKELKTSKTNSEKLMQSVLSALLGEENNVLVNKSTAKKEMEKPSRETKYNSKTLLMDLVKLLQENGKLHAEDLWRMSKFPNDIDAFYAELKKQIEVEKTIKEVASEKGYLELA